jgi:ABC-type transport system substrate-binding protein
VNEGRPRWEAASHLANLVVALGLVTALFGGCSGDASNGLNLRPKQILRMLWLGGNGARVGSLDPAVAAGSADIPIVNLLFDGLVTLNSKLGVEDWGADAVSLSQDGVTYTFHIRAGQTFSDGTPVRASDYAYSIDRALSPCLGSPTGDLLWAIKDARQYSTAGCSEGVPQGLPTLIGDSILADDGAETLTITLAAPSATFLEALTAPASYVVEQRAVAGQVSRQDNAWAENLTKGRTGQGGSGMFYLSGYNSAGHLTLKANPHWWGLQQGRKPYLTEIDFTVSSDINALYGMYQLGGHLGGYDFMGNIPSEPPTGADMQADLHTSPVLDTEMLALNWTSPPFDDLDARAAFCEAVNRDELTGIATEAGAAPSWRLVPSGMPDRQWSATGPDAITSTQGNHNKASQHWANYVASLNGATVPSIQLDVASSDDAVLSLGYALVRQWNAAFPSAHVRLATTAAAGDNGGVSPAAPLSLEDVRTAYPDPRGALSGFTGAAGESIGGAADSRAHTLLARAEAAPNAPARARFYYGAEQTLLNDVAACPLLQRVDFYRMRASVHGYVESAMGFNVDDNWVGLYLTNG